MGRAAGLGLSCLEEGAGSKALSCCPPPAGGPTPDVPSLWGRGPSPGAPTPLPVFGPESTVRFRVFVGCGLWAAGLRHPVWCGAEGKRAQGLAWPSPRPEVLTIGRVPWAFQSRPRCPLTHSGVFRCQQQGGGPVPPTVGPRREQVHQVPGGQTRCHSTLRSRRPSALFGFVVRPLDSGASRRLTCAHAHRPFPILGRRTRGPCPLLV